MKGFSAMKDHKCRLPDYCICSSTILESNEKCPIHSGYTPYPPRCVDCGRFIHVEEKEFPKYYSEPSDIPCSICKGIMTKGDEECAGVCSDCYFKA